jgi:hypothetical protein
MVKETRKNKNLELLKKACPAVFGGLPPDEVTPRYVAFKVPPEIYGPIRKWLKLGMHLEIITGSQDEHCQLYILNREVVAEYNKGRDPDKGYPKSDP